MGRVASRSVLGVALLAVLLAACGGRRVVPIGSGGEPFRPDADERRLWARADREEQALAARTRAYDDPALAEYLARVADRLVPDGVRAAGGPRPAFTVIADPTLNIFAMPNGRVYVHTGLLARLENEAQLATLIAHEIAHVTDRHALRIAAAERNKDLLAGLAASLGVAVGSGAGSRSGTHLPATALSPTANAILGLGLPLAATAAITGYGGDLEHAADAGGIASLLGAGYDAQEGVKVFELLQRDAGDRGPMETFFFGTPSRLQQRLASVGPILRTQFAPAAGAPERVVNTDEFQLRMHAVARENALLDVRAGRFTLAARQLDRVLAFAPRDPTAHLYDGELHRLRSQRAAAAADRKAEAERALASYRRAADLDPLFADPFRQLGFLYYQQKEPAKAREAFEKYLALKPDASDAGRVREYLLELSR